MGEDLLCKASAALQPHKQLFDSALYDLECARKEAAASKQEMKEKWVQKPADSLEYKAVRQAVEAFKLAKQAYKETVEVNVNCFEHGLSPAEANKQCDAAEAEAHRTELAKDQAFEDLIRSS